MDRQLSFQERREALAARRGRFVDMHEDDDTTAAGLVSSSSTNPGGEWRWRRQGEG